jgi:hypothetical protein
MLLSRAFVLPSLTLLAVGCTGYVTGGEGSAADDAPRGALAAPGGGLARSPGAPGAPAPGASPAPPAPAPASPFTCQPRPARAADGWRRLTEREYRNTVRDLLAFALRGWKDPKDDPGAIGSGLPFHLLPDEPVARGAFFRMNDDVTQGHVRAWYEVARAAGRALAATPARLALLVGPCATDADVGNDPRCLADFVARFGERVLRRPLDAAEIEAYRRNAYRDLAGERLGVDPMQPGGGVADVVASLLLAPQFLYHVEHGDGPVAGKSGVFALGAFELASRLSYHFWETMPDEELLKAARDGSLATPEGYARQVARLFSDTPGASTRVRWVMWGFFREWLELEDEDLPRPHLVRDTNLFKAVAGADRTLVTDSLPQTAVEEIRDLVTHHTWQTPGRLDDLLTTNLSFARMPGAPLGNGKTTADLPRLYGVAPWAGGAAPPPAFEPGARPGILTRAAFLVSGTAGTRPILRGVRVRRTILCDPIPEPDNNDVMSAPIPEVSAASTTRQEVEARTETMPKCAGCHRPLINPLGFAFEGYDALGRARAVEALYERGARDPARAGDHVYRQVGTAPVDTRSVPQVVLGDARPSGGAADLVKLIVDSRKPAACFARKYFEFTYRRAHDEAADGCALERLREEVDRNGLKAALRAVVLSPEFRERSFNEARPRP